MASLMIVAINGPFGKSNPRDDTIWIRYLTPLGEPRISWVQNYRRGWATTWHRIRADGTPVDEAERDRIEQEIYGPF